MPDSVQKRLKKSIGDLGLTIKKASQLCEIPYRSLQDYLSGKRKPGTDALIKISTQLRISLDWLLTGEGPMWKEDENKMDPRTEKILQMFEKLSDEAKEDVFKYIQKIKRMNEMENKIKELEKKIVKVG